MTQKYKKLAVIVTLLLVVYIASYLWLSRRGYAEAEHYRRPDFYYFTPEETDAWRYKNFGCMFLFMPLNEIDRALGTGRFPASEPTWWLGRGK